MLQFANGVFTGTSAAATQPCDGGGVGLAQTSETLPLPSTTETPLPRLTGQRTAKFFQGCAGSALADVEYVLTRD